MTFELVRFGWPNVVAIIALAAMPFIALGLPAGPPKMHDQVASVVDGAQRPIVISNMGAQQ